MNADQGTTSELRAGFPLDHDKPGLGGDFRGHGECVVHTQPISQNTQYVLLFGTIYIDSMTESLPNAVLYTFKCTQMLSNKNPRFT